MEASISCTPIQKILQKFPPIQKHLQKFPTNMLSYLLDCFKSFNKSISIDTPISSPNQMKFIEDALFCSSPLALSYSDPDQKWIIQEHLISLFQDFPSFKPSVAMFTHNDGTDVKLLNANGELFVSHHAPRVPITFWVHEFYPHMAPIVHINSKNSGYTIYENYRFADSSGVATSSYLENWHFSKSNLSGLARNLMKLFSHNHPFYYSGRHSGRAHPSTFSKMEAMDRLACSIYYDVAEITTKTQETIQNLSAVQSELRKRGEILENAMSEQEEETRRLRERGDELCEECDRLLEWLKVYDKGNYEVFAIDDALECLDGNSEIELECTAADLAAEDLMYKLDKAVEEGVVSFDVYMKNVRVLAREQFMHRAKKRETEGSNQGFLLI